jgi:curved DNA-binding protein CbpA
VDEAAPWEEVRKAFRAAVRASHPDLHPGDPDAWRRLKELTAAWESVNTPGKWEAYIMPPGFRRTTGDFGRRPHAPGVLSGSRIRVHRQLRGSAGLLNWNLELDGAVVASLESGGSAVLEIEPGRHSVRVFYGSRSSLSLEVELHRGEELVLGCRQLESLRTSLFSPKRSLVLERLSSRPWTGSRRSGKAGQRARRNANSRPSVP